MQSSDSTAPVPGGPQDSGLWFSKLANEVFVCLFVTERREQEFNHLALVECETPGQHPVG